MMNRRAAIMAALCIGSRVSIGQDFQVTIPFDGETTVLEFTIEDESTGLRKINAFKMHYKGRTATVSMDEVMDALGAVPDELKERK